MNPLSTQMLIYLNQQSSHQFISHNALFITFASKYADVDQNRFAIAIQGLKYRNFLLEDAGHYRITSAGRHQANILTGVVIDPATEARRIQNETNYAKKKSANFSIVGTFVTVSIAVLGYFGYSGGNFDGFSFKSLGAVVEQYTTGDNFNLGDKARVVTQSNVQLRSEPGLNTKPKAGIPRYFSAEGNVVFTIRDGPVLIDGLKWWKVSSVIEDGWIAEHAQDGTVLLGKI